MHEMLSACKEKLKTVDGIKRFILLHGVGPLCFRCALPRASMVLYW